MNASALAKKNARVGESEGKAGRAWIEIGEAVLVLGKTQKVGNVSASYSGGRKTYNYMLAITEALGNGRLEGPELDPFEKRTIDYNAACKELGIDAQFTQSEPKVTVKLVG